MAGGGRDNLKGFLLGNSAPTSDGKVELKRINFTRQ